MKIRHGLLASASHRLIARARGLMTMAPDDGSGSGGGAGGGGENGGQQQQDGGQQQQQQQNGSGGQSLDGQQGGQSGGQNGAHPYKPEGLPDHVLGKSDQETIDKLFNENKGFRSQQGERGTVPKEATGYQLEASDKLKPYVANFDKDPVFAKTREIFHAAGVSDKQFNKIVGPWLENLVEGGLVEAPVDAKAQLRSLAPAAAASLDDAGKEAAAAQRVNNNIAWIEEAKTQGVFGNLDKEGKSPIADFFQAALSSDPRAHAAIEWLRGKDAEPRPALQGQGGNQGSSAETLRLRNIDPRNDPRSDKFEPAFAAETDRMFQQQIS